MSDKSPWVSVWCNPRATIRSIVAKDPDRSIWVLGAIYGFLSFLNSFQSIAVGSVLGIIPILLIALALSPVLGLS